jgi:hypothetical protein
MTVAAKRRRAAKVHASSWSTDGPLTVKAEADKGSPMLTWLRFSRPGFEGCAFLSVEALEQLHADLGVIARAAREAFDRYQRNCAPPPAPEAP